MTLLHPMPEHHSMMCVSQCNIKHLLLLSSTTMMMPTVKNQNLAFEKIVELSTLGYDKYTADVPYIVKHCHCQ